MPNAAASALAREACEPCRGGVAPLARDEAEALRAATPAWALSADGMRIEREFKTGTFARALAVVQEIGAVAETQRHHPDIAFGWGYVRVSIQTHAIGGLHRNDFILAAHIDAAMDRS